ncbi:unnamed protein product [[Candida] boidinii]|uniref:Unnamed protein product n=1 Tax=Candida boidinii TaxID=5477 RepID=A0A9W6WF58_CANBO|nr:unnamed protein product [[Candida] boidinii]GMG39492.1 unnamed protein product [[Candida] boidinii]
MKDTDPSDDEPEWVLFNEKEFFDFWDADEAEFEEEEEGRVVDEGFELGCILIPPLGVDEAIPPLVLLVVIDPADAVGVVEAFLDLLIADEQKYRVGMLLKLVLYFVLSMIYD